MQQNVLLKIWFLLFPLYEFVLYLEEYSVFYNIFNGRFKYANKINKNIYIFIFITAIPKIAIFMV